MQWLSSFAQDALVWSKLESDKVIGSLIVPLTWNLRISLTDVLDGLLGPAPDKDEADVSLAQAILIPCVQALLEDSNTCWATTLA